MERIAIISDVHGNITALETALEDIHRRGISRIFCAGDLVMKGSSPGECIDLVRKECEVIVRGNADEHAVTPNMPHIEHKMWHREKIGEDRVRFLDGLPMYYDFYMSGSLIRMFHASKNSTGFRVMDFDDVNKKMQLFEDENGIVPDIVIYGDIHIQYMQKFFNKTIVNTGSIGNPVEDLNHDTSIEDMSETTQAFYILLEGEFGSKERSPLSIQFVRVPYDINKEIELARKNEIPGLSNYILELTTGVYRKNLK